MEHTAVRKKRLPLWLCYGLLLLPIFVGSNFAGYKSTASGADIAGVAGFHYDAAFTGTNSPAVGSTVILNEGDGECISFSVSNFSGNERAAVALRYAVLLKKAGETTEWLPQGVTLSRDMQGAHPFTWDSSRQAYRCDYPTVLQPAENQTEEEYIFIDVGNAAATVLEGLRISVLFEQVN